MAAKSLLPPIVSAPLPRMLNYIKDVFEMRNDVSRVTKSFITSQKQPGWIISSRCGRFRLDTRVHFLSARCETTSQRLTGSRRARRGRPRHPHSSGVSGRITRHAWKPPTTFQVSAMGDNTESKRHWTVQPVLCCFDCIVLFKKKKHQNLKVCRLDIRAA